MAEKAAPAAAAAVTSHECPARHTDFDLALLATGNAVAGVLPEDRADILYHLYDGGGVEIDGPSLLVRKQVGKSTVICRKLLRGYGQLGVDRRHHDCESVYRRT